MSGFLGSAYGAGQRVTPRVFVSYHHGNDQGYYDQFSQLFNTRYSVFTDRSLREEIGSESPDYVMRRIREDFITGSSVTVVLCGRDTPKRKYVDWEIKATLDKQHGLLGIRLPTCLSAYGGGYTVPDRFADNVQSGYALFEEWPYSADALADMLDRARTLSAASSLVVNNRPLMQRNLS